MTHFAHFANWNPGGGDTANGQRVDGAAVAADWTTSLTGGPGRPHRVGIVSWSNDGFAPAAACPWSAPKFAGLSCSSSPGVSSSSQVGIAICTGPAAAADIDEADLTVLQSWLLADTDALDTWWPIEEGVYYYIAIETWDDVALGGLLQALVIDQLYGAAELSLMEYDDATNAPPTFYPTVDWGPTEEIFPVGATIGLGVSVGLAAGHVSVDIDWGDGSTESHGPYDIQAVRVARGETRQGMTWTNPSSFFLPPSLTTESHELAYHHDYTVEGLHTITVTVTDDSGGEQIISKPVAVVGPPTASMTVSPTRVRLPGTVAIDVVATSPTWDLLAARDPATNPDQYDATAGGFGTGAHARTAWELVAGNHTAADGIWEGVGPPPDGETAGDPLPPEPTFIDDTHNRNLLALHNPSPITLRYGDYYRTWEQEINLEVDVFFVRLIPTVRQRQIPGQVRQRQMGSGVRQRQIPR